MTIQEEEVKNMFTFIGACVALVGFAAWLDSII